MKIAIVSDAVAPWHTGGKEHRYREILRHLPKQDGGGDEITVYTMRWWEGKAPAAHVALMPKIPLYRRDGRRSTLQGLLFAVACLRMLVVEADVIEADHMPGPQILTLAVVAKLRKTPLVVSWHEWWGREGWKTYLGKLWWLGAAIEKLSAQSATVVVVGIEETRQRLIRAGVNEARVRLVPYGVQAISSGGGRRRGVISYGRLTPHKRLDIAIEAIRILVERGENTKLTIIGDGPEKERLENLAERLGVLDHVTFTGRLEHQSDVWSEVEKSEVCVMPSEREGFGLAVAEALWLSTPAVVSDHRDNAAKWLVEDGTTGIIVKSGDAQAFADGIMRARLLDHSSIGKRFQTGRRAVRWEESAAEIHAVWSEAAKK